MASSGNLHQGLPRDIIFVLDSSGSLSGYDFEKALTFTRKFVGLFDQHQAKFAVVNFSSTAKVEFNLNTYQNIEQVSLTDRITISLFCSKYKI